MNGSIVAFFLVNSRKKRYFLQSCGSESTWIHIHLAVLDPDLYWELTKFTNKPGFLPFEKAFVFS